MAAIYNSNSSSPTPVFQQKPEEVAKQFLIETLDGKELPNGSLQDILKDGILLCEYVNNVIVNFRNSQFNIAFRLIKRFSPNECIIKNEGGTIFAYVRFNCIQLHFF